MKIEVRYTINRDGTLEKWYLEAERDGMVYLRKTAIPKRKCGKPSVRSRCSDITAGNNPGRFELVL